MNTEPLLLQEDYDSDQDGNIDYSTRYSYDQRGNLIEAAEDDFNADTFDTTTFKTYDKDNNLISESADYDSDGDGVTDIETVTSYTYNQRDQLTSLVSRENGQTIFTERYTFDHKGNETSHTTVYEGGSPSTISYTYDKDSNQTGQFYDQDGNGIIESSRLDTYDENGNQLSYFWYENRGDGDIPQYGQKYTYDENNNLTRSVSLNRRGKEGYGASYTYNENNDLTSRTRFDNRGKATNVYTITYNDNNQLIREDYEGAFSNGLINGKPDQSYFTTYNADGNIESRTLDYDADGTIDDVLANYRYYADGTLKRANLIEDEEVLQYDERGNLTSEVLRNVARGIPYQKTAYSYDDNNQLIREELFYRAQGLPRRIRTYGTVSTAGPDPNSPTFIETGTNGRDRFVGTNKKDAFDAKQGNDLLIGRSGDDALIGGAGNDNLFGNSGDDTLEGSQGQDDLNGGNGSDALSGGNGNDELNGGKGNDTLTGGKGNDKLVGGKGKDTLTGGAGNDRLLGGRGDDLLTGGLGKDLLIGAQGKDTFVLALDSGRDVITDFSHEDSLMLSGGLGIRDLTFSGEAIIFTETNQVLAVLIGVDTSNIGFEQFV